MSSFVFYKFKNQKEPERIAFHGTGISVFELKREIIAATGLGDGTDFDLHLYPEDDPTTEYDDDTTIILRTNTVIVARRPAPRGHGKAARYVTGKAPVRALPKTAAKPAASAAAVEDAEAAFFAESNQNWEQQKEALSRVKQVHHKRKPVNVPNHDPPAGYVCYRCQKKGHWIQLCPTNDDPDFKPVARPKRTTGIPRSFMKVVEKPVDEEDARGVMLNAEGEYVQVLTDTKSWEKFQEKQNAVKAQAAAVNAINKEALERGLACPIDQRMFVDPMKTPCCSKTFCHACIDNALAEGDLVCPGCGAENVLMENLVSDDEMLQKVKSFEAEKAKEKAEKEQQAKEKAQAAATPSTPKNDDCNSVPASDDATKSGENTGDGSKSPKPSGTSVAASGSNIKSPLTVAAKVTSADTPGASGNGSDSEASTTSKKRKEPPTEIKPPTAPKAMRQQKEQEQRQPMDQNQAMIQNFKADMEQMSQTTYANMPVCMPMQANPMMAMAGVPNMNGMGMNGPMPGFGSMNGNWNNGFNQPFPNNMGFGGNMNQGWNSGYANNMPYGNMGNPMNGMNGMNGYGGNWNQNQGYNNMGNGWQGQQQMGGGFPNQQRTSFNEQPNNNQDAYERKPLNPHRAQNKHRKARAPDFHVL